MPLPAAAASILLGNICVFEIALFPSPHPLNHAGIIDNWLLTLSEVPLNTIKGTKAKLTTTKIIIKLSPRIRDFAQATSH